MATYPHVKLTAFGTLGTGGGNEIWSCGLKVVLAEAGALNVPVAPNARDLEQLAVVTSLGWIDLMHGRAGDAAGGSLISADAIMTGVKAAAVAADGKDDPLVPSFINEPAPVTGSAPAGIVPYSVALAVTLRGVTFKRGAAAFGRFYLPVPNIFALPDSAGQFALVNGVINNPTPLGFARQVGRLLDRINGLVLDSAKLPLVSNISKSTAAAGLRFQNVTIVTCDNRPDTIRRRSNKIGGQGVGTATLPIV